MYQATYARPRRSTPYGMLFGGIVITFMVLALSSHGVTVVHVRTVSVEDAHVWGATCSSLGWCMAGLATAFGLNRALDPRTGA